jgi:hypothetical protein
MTLADFTRHHIGGVVGKAAWLELTWLYKISSAFRSMEEELALCMVRE